MYKSYKEPFLKIIKFFGKKVEEKQFSKEPIYIGGCGRSGTTLLLSIISSHPEIFACPEELEMFNKVETDNNGKKIPKRIDRLYRTLLTNKIDDTCNRWCEKSPTNVRHIQDMDSFHDGKFKFLNIVRDGRDVILSKHPTSPSEYWVSPERWVKDVKAGFKEEDNPNVYTVRYEDLILNFEEEIKKICSFLEVPVCHEILNWHEYTTVRKNRAYFGKVKNIFKTSIGKWKKPEHKARVEQLLEFDEAKMLLSKYGYEV